MESQTAMDQYYNECEMMAQGHIDNTYYTCLIYNQEAEQVGEFLNKVYLKAGTMEDLLKKVNEYLEENPSYVAKDFKSHSTYGEYGYKESKINQAPIYGEDCSEDFFELNEKVEKYIEKTFRAHDEDTYIQYRYLNLEELSFAYECEKYGKEFGGLEWNPQNNILGGGHYMVYWFKGEENNKQELPYHMVKAFVLDMIKENNIKQVDEYLDKMVEKDMQEAKKKKKK